jgi:acyl dehydratase
VASYKVNRRAVANIKRLIEAGQYVIESDWDESQPTARDENSFLAKHSFREFAEWHLGLTEGATDETKARYAFVVGDFQRIHRSGIIAAHFRAAQYFHKDVELAAHRLLQPWISGSAKPD